MKINNYIVRAQINIIYIYIYINIYILFFIKKLLKKKRN